MVNCLPYDSIQIWNKLADCDWSDINHVTLLAFFDWTKI